MECERAKVTQITSCRERLAILFRYDPVETQLDNLPEDPAKFYEDLLVELSGFYPGNKVFSDFDMFNIFCER